MRYLVAGSLTDDQLYHLLQVETNRHLAQLGQVCSAPFQYKEQQWLLLPPTAVLIDFR